MIAIIWYHYKTENVYCWYFDWLFLKRAFANLFIKKFLHVNSCETDFSGRQAALLKMHSIVSNKKDLFNCKADDRLENRYDCQCFIFA